MLRDMNKTAIVDHSIDAIRDWLAPRFKQRHQIAKDAGVDEKTIRQSFSDNWDPRASTLRKLEAVIPAKKQRRSA